MQQAERVKKREQLLKYYGLNDTIDTLGESDGEILDNRVREAVQSKTKQTLVNELVENIPETLSKLAYLYAHHNVYFVEELNNVALLLPIHGNADNKYKQYETEFKKLLTAEIGIYNIQLKLTEFDDIETSIKSVQEKIVKNNSKTRSLINENDKNILNDTKEYLKLKKDKALKPVNEELDSINTDINNLEKVSNKSEFQTFDSDQLKTTLDLRKNRVEDLNKDLKLAQSIESTREKNIKQHLEDQNLTQVKKEGNKTIHNILKAESEIKQIENLIKLQDLNVRKNELEIQKKIILNDGLSNEESQKIQLKYESTLKEIEQLRKEFEALYLDVEKQNEDFAKMKSDVNKQSDQQLSDIFSESNNILSTKNSISYLVHYYKYNKSELDKLLDGISSEIELRQHCIEELVKNNLIIVMLDRLSLEEKQSLIHQMSNEQQASYKPLLTLIKSTILRINGNSRENFDHKVKKFSSVITESTDLSKLVDDAREILLNPIDKLALTVTLIRKKYKDLTSDELKEYIEKLNGNNINAKQEIANALIQTPNHMKLAKTYYEEIGEYGYNDFITKLSSLVISDISNDSYDLQTFSKILDNFKDDSTVINDLLKQIISKYHDYDKIIKLIENAADVKDVKSKIDMADILNELYKKISQDKFYNERKEIRRELLEKINGIYVDKLAEKTGDNQLGIILEKCSGTNIYNSLRIAVDKISKNSNQNDVLNFKDISSDEIIGNTILCAPNLPTYDKSKVALERVIDSKNISLSTLDKLREFFRPVLSILGSTPDPQMLMSAAAYVIGAKMKHGLTNGEDKTKLNNIKDEVQTINGKTSKGRNT